MAVAWAQLIFNLVMVLAVLLLLHIFRGRLESSPQVQYSPPRHDAMTTTQIERLDSVSYASSWGAATFLALRLCFEGTRPAPA
jgi:hypothetical protein